MDARSNRLYWRAVNHLREAETLADIKTLAGPTDAPPEKPEDEKSWQEEWAAKAKRALKKANEWLVEKPSEVAKERARGIAEHVRRGAGAIKRAAKSVSEKVVEVADTANKIGMATVAASWLMTLALAYLAWRVYKGR